MLKLVKPNGQKVEINEHPDNIAMAKKLGWKKATRKTKEKE